MNNKPLIKKNSLHVFYTGKTSIVKPNTLLSPASRFLLIVFQKYYVVINNQFIQQILSPFGQCAKVIYQYVKLSTKIFY